MEKDKTKKKTTTKEKKEEPPKNEEEDPKQKEEQPSPSPEKSEKITNIKTVKVNFTAPSNLIDRIDFVNKVFNNEELVYKNSNAPEKTNIDEIGTYFVTEYNSYPMAIAGILYYISQNFKLDRINLDKTKVPGQDLESVIQNGKGTSEGITTLFMEILKRIGVKCQLVTGLIKRKGYKQGDSLRRHNWVAINVGKTYFIDPALFMGEIEDMEEDEKAETPFHPFYFLTPPELLINTHRPDNDDFQMIGDKPLDLKKFLLKPYLDIEDFYYKAFKNKVQLISHPSPEFECKNSEMDIKFNIENMNASAEIYYKGKLYEDKENKCKYDDPSKLYNLHIKFTNDGLYTITLKSKSLVNNEDIPKPVLTYKVKVTIINIIKKPLKKVLPGFSVRQNSVGARDLSAKVVKTEKRKLTKSASEFEKKKKMKCYDNKNAHLYEPKSDFLKVGQETKFKVKVRNAKSVIVVDGKHMNYLKRKEDDIYEGSVNIKNSNVSVCMLKEGGVFTEVFEFFAIKPQVILPK